MGIEATSVSDPHSKMMDPDEPELGWCMSNCGLCFELCTTGGTAQGLSPPAGECIVIQLENRCGDGLGEASNYLCGQEMSPWECLENPSQCKTLRNTNMFGYPAHFDLQKLIQRARWVSSNWKRSQLRRLKS